MNEIVGQRLCGDVRFAVTPPLREVIVCHCTQCRRWSGHIWAASAVAPDRFRLISDASLRWYRASAIAARGFCERCGSSLFWRPDSGSHISFAAGALTAPTGLVMGAPWCVADKGDYYDLPQAEARA